MPQRHPLPRQLSGGNFKLPQLFGKMLAGYIVVRAMVSPNGNRQSRRLPLQAPRRIRDRDMSNRLPSSLV